MITFPLIAKHLKNSYITFPKKFSVFFMSDLPYNWKSQPHQSSTQSYLTVRIRSPPVDILCRSPSEDTFRLLFAAFHPEFASQEKKSKRLVAALNSSVCVWPLVGCISSGSPGKFSSQQNDTSDGSKLRAAPWGHCIIFI